MKKSLIVTLYGNFNYGNKLQNYAVQEYLKKYDIITFTLTDYYNVEKKDKLKKFLKKIIKILLPKYRKRVVLDKRREKKFEEFDNLIQKIKIKNVDLNSIDYIFVGSDQIWNPNDIMALEAINYINNLPNGKFKIISFSASISLSSIPVDKKELLIEHFNKIDFISVREELGKNIINSFFDNEKNVDVLLDPTMLVELDCWEKVMKQPPEFKKRGFQENRYILTYFLGAVFSDRTNEIKRIANEHNCRIINLLDLNDPFYTCNPSEFLWLQKHAFLVCTDSFHSCVFSILYKRPFIVFNREDGQVGKNVMNSRIENLLTKFHLTDRYFTGFINDNLLSLNENIIDSVLEKEKNKANIYIKNSIK